MPRREESYLATDPRYLEHIESYIPVPLSVDAPECGHCPSPQTTREPTPSDNAGKKPRSFVKSYPYGKYQAYSFRTLKGSRLSKPFDDVPSGSRRVDIAPPLPRPCFDSPGWRSLHRKSHPLRSLRPNGGGRGFPNPCPLNLSMLPARASPVLDMNVYTDASIGAIGVSINRRWLAWNFAEPLGTERYGVVGYIRWAELIAVELALRALVAQGHGSRQIPVHVDSAEAILCLERGFFKTARSENLL